ncbi:MAG: site-specific DNA-methyltransferase [Myxococcales bacterium]|nr:site-specific DNA-methyltransferase [Myxococcales bacterium]
MKRRREENRGDASIRLVASDSLAVPQFLADASVALAYLDPPFAVGVEFRARTQRGELRAAGKSAGPVAYVDKWPTLDAYLAWLEERLRAVASVLAPTGTVWLHLDGRAVHEAKRVMDVVFGRDAFRGEVIWVPGNGVKTRRGPGLGHQTLLCYAPSDAFTWNGKDPALRAPFAKTSLAMHFKSVDGEGRAYRERVVNKRAYRYYADEGRAIGSVWTDCPSMVANTPLRDETTGYPTQKPLKLLDRIVRASSREGELVLDGFCGSGTTLEAAARAGRRAIGFDCSPLAIATTKARLEKAGLGFTLEP